MKKLLLMAVLVVGCCCKPAQPAAIAKDSGSVSGQSQTATGSTEHRPKKVRANTQGFDLDPKSGSQGGGMSMGAGSRGGEASTIVLYAPNLGLAYTLHPLFQWAAQSGNMTFRLYDPDDNEVFEADVTGHSSFLYPQNAPPLKAGDTYRWTVQKKALGVTEPPPSARFKVVSGAQRQQLDQALKQIPGEGKLQQMQRAKLFSDHEIWYDAVTVYSQLIADYPNDAKLYQSRAEIYEAIPQTKELAAQDMTKAKAGQ